MILLSRSEKVLLLMGRPSIEEIGSSISSSGSKKPAHSECVRNAFQPFPTARLKVVRSAGHAPGVSHARNFRPCRLRNRSHNASGFQTRLAGPRLRRSAKWPIGPHLFSADCSCRRHGPPYRPGTCQRGAPGWIARNAQAEERNAAVLPLFQNAGPSDCTALHTGRHPFQPAIVRRQSSFTTAAA